MPEMYLRSFVLDDIGISRSHAGGRTVEAYAAIFNSPYEVNDQYGHYMEVIERSAFDRTLKHGIHKTMCLYNHGMDLRGKSEPKYGVPLGTPLEIRPDERGLLTITRYNKGEIADLVLESIRNGDIKSQSFRGGIYRSSPMGRVPKRPPGTPMTTVTRHELGLADYGPTPMPVNDEDMAFAVRSAAELAHELASLPEAERAELYRALASTTPHGDPETHTATSQMEPGAEDPHHVHSGRQSEITRRIRVAQILKGI